MKAIDKPILHLNLIGKWFDMVDAEIKLEEYRKISEYWSRIFIGTGIKIKGKNYHPTDVTICFSNGYSKNRRQMYVAVTGLRTDFGKSEWGAIPDEQYFVLSLKKIF